MNKYYTFAAIFLGSFVHTMYGQESNADFARSMGKMYVVVAVILAVLIGVLIFLIFLERKISRLENSNDYE